MTQSLNFINEFEETFEVQKWTVNGLHIWPAIRIPLISEWESHLYYKPDEVLTEKPSFIQKLQWEYALWKLAFKSWKESTKYSPKFKADIGVWEYDYYSYCNNSIRYSRFSDALKDLESENNLEILSVCLSEKQILKGYYNSIEIISDHMVRRYYAKILSLFSSRKKINFDLDSARNWCSSRKLPSESLKMRKILHSFFYLRELKDQYVRIIKHHSLTTCLKVCWYNLDGMALAWAAKEANIICYDLQHGIAGATKSRAYSQWSRIPKNGYKIMPDGFWCWTEEDAEAIDEWGKLQNSPIRTFVGGNVWARLWNENKYPSSFFSDKLIKAKYLKSKGIKIMFSLQDEYIPTILFELLEHAPSSWNWWVRCHPRYLDHLPLIQSQLHKYNNIEVLNVSKDPLPLLLKHADVHITPWSAVAFDAKEFGLTSIVCHPSAEIFFQKEIERGDFLFATDFNQIINLIKSKQYNKNIIENNTNYPSFKNEISLFDED